MNTLSTICSIVGVLLFLCSIVAFVSEEWSVLFGVSLLGFSFVLFYLSAKLKPDSAE